AGLRRACIVGRVVSTPALYARVGSSRYRGVLYARQDLRDGRPANLLARSHRKRPHPQAPCCRRGWFLDSADAAETPNDTESVSSIDDAASDDGRHRPAFELPAIER